MAESAITVNGMAELSARLKGLAEDIRTKAMEQSVRASAKVFYLGAYNNAPYALREYLCVIKRTDRSWAGSQSAYSIGIRRKGKLGIAPSRIAHFFEFGTKQHPTEPNPERRAKAMMRQFTGARRITKNTVEKWKASGFEFDSTGAKMMLHWSPNNWARKTEPRGMRMIPFMRPAFDNRTEEAIGAAGKKLEQRIEAYVKAGFSTIEDTAIPLPGDSE